jgi:hypothetical protein
MIIAPVLVAGFISALAIGGAYAFDAVKNRMPRSASARFRF